MAQRIFPIDVGLNAIAVANVNSSGTGQPLRRTLQSFHTPVCRLFHVHIESGLVELNNVHAVGLQCQCFLIEQFCKSHGHFDFVTIKTIGHSVHNGHGARQGELQFLLGVGTRELRFKGMHATF